MSDYQTTTSISPERICDMVVGAFEGGSNYWIGRGLVQLISPAQQTVPNPDGVVWWGRKALYEGEFKITIYSTDEERDLVLDNAAVARGLEVMSKDYARHFADLVNENDDADTADVFLQCCLFGELVYG